MVDDSTVKEIEEDTEAKLYISVLCTTELTWTVFALLLEQGVTTPSNIRQILDVAVASSKVSENDSPEMRLGRKVFSDSLSLLLRKLKEYEKVKAAAETSSSLNKVQ